MNFAHYVPIILDLFTHSVAPHLEDHLRTDPAAELMNDLGIQTSTVVHVSHHDREELTGKNIHNIFKDNDSNDEVLHPFNIHSQFAEGIQEEGKCVNRVKCNSESEA